MSKERADRRKKRSSNITSGRYSISSCSTNGNITVGSYSVSSCSTNGNIKAGGASIYSFNGNITAGHYSTNYSTKHIFTAVEVTHHHEASSAEHILPRKLYYFPSKLLIHSVADDEKLDDASHLIMPDIAETLLPFILPKKLRAAVAGDLAEDFHTYAAQWGRSYALWWLWWELGALCIRRFGPTAIMTAVGMWFRQKLGL